MTTSTDFTNCSELWQLCPASFCFCFFVSLYQPWTEISETSTSCTELLSSHAGVTSVSLNNRSEWWTGQGNDWTPKKRNNADISTLTIYHEAIFGLCWLSLTRPITFVASSSPDFGSLSAWSWALGPFAPSLPLTGRNWNDKISEIMQTEGRDREDRGNNWDDESRGEGRQRRQIFALKEKLQKVNLDNQSKGNFWSLLAFLDKNHDSHCKLWPWLYAPCHMLLSSGTRAPIFAICLAWQDLKWSKIRKRKTAEETTWTLSLLAIFCLCTLS